MGFVAPVLTVAVFVVVVKVMVAAVPAIEPPVNVLAMVGTDVVVVAVVVVAGAIINARSYVDACCCFINHRW